MKYFALSLSNGVMETKPAWLRTEYQVIHKNFMSKLFWVEISVHGVWLL